MFARGPVALTASAHGALRRADVHGAASAISTHGSSAVHGHKSARELCDAGALLELQKIHGIVQPVLKA